MAEELEKEEKKELIKPIMLVPEVDKDGHAVFRCINKEDEEVVATALSPSTSKGLKVKPAKENTCPLEPDTPYEKSICKVINDLFKKRKKGKENKKDKKCRTCS